MDKISDVIAQQESVFEYKDGRRVHCIFIFGKITKTEMGWCCPFQIFGYEQNLVHKAYGVDSLQALKAAFELINVEIELASKNGCFLEDGHPIESIIPRQI